MIAAVLAVGAAGQIYSIAADTDALWPLNPVAVYRKFPADYRTTSSEAFVVTPEGERHAVKSGAASQRVVRRFRAAVDRAAGDAERRRAAELFYRYLAAQSPGGSLTGVRMYRLEWDLREGRVLERRLRAEYVEP